MGTGPGAAATGYNIAPGAGYGGVGGNDRDGRLGGPTYGSATQPTDLGSGGSPDNNAWGGHGGGAIRLVVADLLALDGVISANGLGAGPEAGGGSGGSIWVTANSITGAGSIKADGGGADSYYSGGGAGTAMARNLTPQGPYITATTPGDHTNDHAITAITLDLSQAVLGDAARDATNYTLMFLGANRVAGGGDDVTIPVTPAYTDGATQIMLTVAAPCTEGLYQLTVRSGTTTGLRDLADRPLDQNRDGWALDARNSGAISNGQWQHIASTWTGTTWKNYLNGVLVGSGTHTGSLVNLPAPFVLGSNSEYNTTQFGGAMAEVRVWSVARSQADIQAAIYGRMAGDETDLVGYRPMDEGSGATLRDASNHGNDGALGAINPAARPAWQALPLPMPRRTLLVSYQDAGGMDPASAGSDLVYWLERTNGDGVFDDGDDIDMGALELAFDQATHVASVRAATWLPTDIYRLIVSGTVRDRAGNPLAAGTDWTSGRDAHLRGGLTNESVTLELWFKADGPGVLVAETAGPSPNSGGWHDSQIELLSSGELRVRVWTMGSVSLGAVGLNQWHHVALRYNRATSTLDGLLDGVPSTTAVSGDRQAPWESGYAQHYLLGATEGTHLGYGGYFTGAIDDFRVWSVARSTADIATDRTRRLNGDEPGLVAYYTLDDGYGDQAVDQTAARRTATLASGGQRPTWAAADSPCTTTAMRGST